MKKENKTCESFQEDLVLLVDGELDEEQKAHVLEHVKQCKECSAVLDDLKRLNEKMQLWPVADPSESWEHRTEEQIRKQAQDLLPTKEKESGDGKSKPPAKVIFLRPWFLSAAAASVLLLVSVLGLTLVNKARPIVAESANALPGDKPGHEYTIYGHKNMKSFGGGPGFGGGSPSHAGAPGQVASKGTWGQGANFDGDAYIKSRSKYQYERTKELVTKRTQKLKIIRLGSVSDEQEDVPVVHSAPKNGWYQSNYRSGQGERERVEKLIREGVVVDGSKIKLDSLARSYHQKFPVPGHTALALYADVDHSKVLASGGDVFLQLGIQAATREMPRRPSLNIALVIDRSGSMGSDGKMKEARNAALKFIDRLRDDDDVVVIAYDDRIETPCGGDVKCDRESTKAYIRSLDARGSTNIHGALDRAYRMVADRSAPGKLNTVILISDGMPTAGITDEASIVNLARIAAENNISTTSVGMGLEYNDKLMMHLASQGQGHYHFVKNASSMETILKEEFDSLNRVVARALRLKIKLADDVVLKRVLGSRALDWKQTAQVRSEERHLDDKLYRELGIKKDRQEDDHEGIRMLIPYFFSGDSHVVMLHLYLPPGTNPERIAEVTLKYKDMLHSKNNMAEKEVVVSRAKDVDQMVKSINRKVKKNLLGFRAGETLMTVAQMINNGQEQRAAQMIGDQAEMFRQAGQRWSDDDLLKDARLLDQYQGVILKLQDPNLAAKSSLRAYLTKTMSHSAYGMFR